MTEFERSQQDRAASGTGPRYVPGSRMAPPTRRGRFKSMDAILYAVSRFIWSFRIDPVSVINKLTSLAPGLSLSLAKKSIRRGVRASVSSKRVSTASNPVAPPKAWDTIKPTAGALKRATDRWEHDCVRVLFVLWSSGRCTPPPAKHLSVKRDLTNIISGDMSGRNVDSFTGIGAHGIPSSPWMWTLTDKSVPVFDWVGSEIGTRKAVAPMQPLPARALRVGEWSWVPPARIADTRRSRDVSAARLSSQKATILWTSRDSETATLFWTIRQMMPGVHVIAITKECAMGFSAPPPRRMRESPDGDGKHARDGDAPALVEWVSASRSSRHIAGVCADRHETSIIICVPKVWGRSPVPLHTTQMVWSSTSHLGHSKTSKTLIPEWLSTHSPDKHMHIWTWRDIAVLDDA